MNITDKIYMSDKEYFEVRKMFDFDLEKFWKLPVFKIRAFFDKNDEMVEKWVKELRETEIKHGIRYKYPADCVHNNDHQNELGTAFER